MPDAIRQHTMEKNMTCLVIDDNESFRQIASAYLGQHGIAVEEAENGEVALRKYLQCPDKYDLLLLDIQMPVMNGFEVLHAIRTSGMQNGKTIPVIGISGASNITNNHPFDYFLHKPFNLNRLFAAIEQVMGWA